MFHGIETEVLKQLLSNVQAVQEHIGFPENSILQKHSEYYAATEQHVLNELRERGFAQNELGVVEPVV